MRNLALASAIGFDPARLSESGFQTRWAVFRDNEHSKFLRLYMEKRLVELQLLFESAKPEDVHKLQGQVAEVKKFLQFLAQENISNEVASMKAFLHLPK